MYRWIMSRRYCRIEESRNDFIVKGCSRIAQSLALQLNEYREGVEVAGRLQNARNILGDAMR